MRYLALNMPGALHSGQGSLYMQEPPAFLRMEMRALHHLVGLVSNASRLPVWDRSTEISRLSGALSTGPQDNGIFCTAWHHAGLQRVLNKCLLYEQI